MSDNTKLSKKEFSDILDSVDCREIAELKHILKTEMRKGDDIDRQRVIDCMQAIIMLEDSL